MKTTNLLAAAAIATAGIATPSHGVQQASTDAPEELEEIIITVDRRAQSLQDVASLAQAFSQEDLKKLGIGSELRNLTVAIPGVNISNQEGNIEIFIRGVGTSNNTELGDPSAATHINGVYIPRPRGLGAMFYDLERVEVNKGPQGTTRGRNAVAGSINLITKRPVLGEVEGYIEGALGNFDSREFQGAINLPVGDTFAVRASAFTEYHDSYFNNAGLDQNLTPAGVEDEVAFRLSGLWEPNDRLSVFLMADYGKEGGTGYPGANLFTAFQAGFDFDDLDARDTVNRGWQGELDSQNYGFQAQISYEFDGVTVTYSGSRRIVDFEQINAQTDGIAFPGRDLAAVDYDNFGNVFWDTNSKSSVHELFFSSNDEDSRLQFSGGLFYFNEDQDTGFFSTADNGFCCFSGVEFTTVTDSNSKAAFADITYALTDNFRIKGGLRYTDEEKSRVGVGGNYALIAGGDGFACCFSARFSTPGFVPAFLDRPSLTPPTNGNPVDQAQFLLDGVTSFGFRDTLDDQLQAIINAGGNNAGACLDSPVNDERIDNGFVVCGPDNTFSFLTVTTPGRQEGTFEADFLDWRVGFEYDYGEDGLLYGSVTTAHKSGGFNDSLPGPDGGVLNGITFDNEKVTSFELGTKNVFDLNGHRAILNASAFYYLYDDLVLPTQVSLGGEGSNVGLSQQNVNISDSTVLGIEVESAIELGNGFNFGANLLYLDTEIKDGVVSDFRAQDFGNFANTPEADLSGNRLALASKFTAILRLGQTIDLGADSFDWLVLANYRSSYHLTPFNQQDIQFRDGTVGDAASLGFADEQDGYVQVNVNAGYSFENGVRVEGYITNLFNIDASTKSIQGPNLNLRFLNLPRTAGVRIRTSF
ncbi:TonB-dependent receptor [Kordiimonas sp. SCSIO 12603]|uniref:TonB-dependent receptor n=1 Tax=Kordiimonas sp. SCSIO 12603 TaxID=2829596 RepID=UPI0021027B8B|nr:TonB-dependent receptor [Kordiimonas sp. SCSIO 12603]UTW58812.1 TonB-dependent receptor [Kordiimonas sp. SCSIO 12603]